LSERSFVDVGDQDYLAGVDVLDSAGQHAAHLGDLGKLVEVEPRLGALLERLVVDHGVSILYVVAVTLLPAVEATLSALAREIEAILGPELVGIYLYGSLASGDFSPETSDIDFLVVTRNLLLDST